MLKVNKISSFNLYFVRMCVCVCVCIFIRLFAAKQPKSLHSKHSLAATACYYLEHEIRLTASLETNWTEPKTLE